MKTANPLRPVVVIKEGQQNKDFQMALAAWTKSHLLSSDVMVTFVAMVTYLYSGATACAYHCRHAIEYTPEFNIDTINH